MWSISNFSRSIEVGEEGHRVANRASIPVSKESLGRVMALDLGLGKDATINAYWLNDEVSECTCMRLCDSSVIRLYRVRC